MPENLNLGPLIVARAVITDHDRLLFVCRSENDSNNPGKLESPGGKLDEGETIYQGVVREVLEETGLEVLPRLDVVHLDDEILQEGKYEGRHYLSAFCLAHIIGGELRLSDEHSREHWLTFGRALDADLTPKTRGAILAFRRNGLL